MADEILPPDGIDVSGYYGAPAPNSMDTGVLASSFDGSGPFPGVVTASGYGMDGEEGDDFFGKRKRRKTTFAGFQLFVDQEDDAQLTNMIQDHNHRPVTRRDSGPREDRRVRKPQTTRVRADSSASAGGRGGASSGNAGIPGVDEFEVAKKTPGVQNATRRILEWLQQGPLSLPELSQRLTKLSRSKVQMVLDIICAAGLIRLVRRRPVVLTPETAETLPVTAEAPDRVSLAVETSPVTAEAASVTEIASEQALARAGAAVAAAASDAAATVAVAGTVAADGNAVAVTTAAASVKAVIAEAALDSASERALTPAVIAVPQPRQPAAADTAAAAAAGAAAAVAEVCAATSDTATAAVPASAGAAANATSVDSGPASSAAAAAAPRVLTAAAAVASAALSDLPAAASFSAVVANLSAEAQLQVELAKLEGEAAAAVPPAIPVPLAGFTEENGLDYRDEDLHYELVAPVASRERGMVAMTSIGTLSRDLAAQEEEVVELRGRLELLKQELVGEPGGPQQIQELLRHIFMEDRGLEDEPFYAAVRNAVFT